MGATVSHPNREREYKEPPVLLAPVRLRLTDPAALLLARQQHSRGAPLTFNSGDKSKRERRMQDGAPVMSV